MFIENEVKPDTLQSNGQTIIFNSLIKTSVIDASRLYVVFAGEKIKVKKLILLPNYLDSLNKGSCDLALIELEQSISTVSPAILNKSFNELNSNVVGVGFGTSGIADKPESVDIFHKKIAGENVIDSITGHQYLG